jgi:Flp pilus assembly protein TadD
MRRSLRPETVERLLSNVEWALANGLGPRDLVPMLERLLAHAEAGSSAWRFAHQQLAAVLVHNSPWRAALLARRVLRVEDDARTWGVLGLAQTLLGNYRSACRAYRRALALLPDCPEFAHNLGHLLDAALNRPKAALPFLRSAQRALPHEPEIATSLAHALARSGRIQEAESILRRELDDPEAAPSWIAAWLAADPPGSGVAPE